MGGTKKRKTKNHHKKEASGNRGNCTVIGKAPENIGISQNVESENSAIITTVLKETPDNQENGVAVVKATPGYQDNGGTMVKETSGNQENGVAVVKETQGNRKNGVTIVKETPGYQDNGGTMVKETSGKHENGVTVVKETPANQNNGKTMIKVIPRNPENDMSVSKGTSQNNENGMRIVKEIPKKLENDKMTMVKGTFENRENGMSRVKVLPGNQDNSMLMAKETPGNHGNSIAMVNKNSENQENALTMVKNAPENQKNGVTVVKTTENLENDTTMVKRIPENKQNVLGLEKKTIERQQNVLTINKKTAEDRDNSMTTENQDNVSTKVKGSKKSETCLVINEALENLANMKHPLENTWGFWLYTNLNKKNWTENQVELTHFDTVEDYWCLYHHMKLPSKLKLGQDYAVFKKGISPMWEDRANKNGGRWLIGTDRQPEMDRIWLDVVLLMIGGNFENSDIICGAVVNIRGAKSRVTLWTKTKDEQSNMVIGRKLKEQLQVNFRLQFCVHNSNSAIFVV